MPLAPALGRGGSNRVPSAIKKARGTARADRMNAREPSVEWVEIGAAPERLPELVRQVWATLAPEVNGLRVAATGDLLSFERMCWAAALVIETYQDPDAKVGEKVAADKNLMLWLGMFGLTPSMRQKVSSLGSKGEADPLDEFVS